MFFKIKVSCTCGCSYTVGQDIKTSKIICPNCGMEHPQSDKLISLLKIASEIPDGDFLSGDVSNTVISESEYVNNPQ